MTAVLVGTLLSAAYFIAKMGMNSIRRRYSGVDMTSKKIRSHAQYDCLKANGEQIQVFELQGPIFFGSADNLARAVEAGARQASFCILDLNRVTEIDRTGAVILIRLYKSFVRSGRHLLLTHIKDGRSMRDFLTVTGVLSDIDDRHRFHDTDGALEWAEDGIIAQLCHQSARKRYRLTFEGFERLRGDHPQIALKFVANIALVISHRLRVRSQEVRMLADG